MAVGRKCVLHLRHSAIQAVVEIERGLRVPSASPGRASRSSREPQRALMPFSPSPCSPPRPPGIRATRHRIFDVEDGARTFASICANCHGPDGNLIAGIDLGRGQFAARSPTTSSRGSSRTASRTPRCRRRRISEEQVERVVAFLRANAAAKPTAASTGNAARGKALFEGKGECRDCHRVDGHGSAHRPDLSTIGGCAAPWRSSNRCSSPPPRCRRTIASTGW